MSYADVAASGPSQTAAEVSLLTRTGALGGKNLRAASDLRAPAPPVVEHKEEAHTSSLIDVDSPHVISVPSSYSGETTTQVEREDREASIKAQRAEETARKEAQKARDKLRKAENKAWRNRENPVVIGNAAILGFGALALGAGAFYKYSRNELSGRLVGIWAAGLTAFAVGDFFTSQWLFKNKYPAK